MSQAQAKTRVLEDALTHLTGNSNIEVELTSEGPSHITPDASKIVLNTNWEYVRHPKTGNPLDNVEEMVCEFDTLAHEGWHEKASDLEAKGRISDEFGHYGGIAGYCYNVIEDRYINIQRTEDSSGQRKWHKFKIACIWATEKPLGDLSTGKAVARGLVQLLMKLETKGTPQDDRVERILDEAKPLIEEAGHAHDPERRYELSEKLANIIIDELEDENDINDAQNEAEKTNVGGGAIDDDNAESRDFDVDEDDFDTDMGNSVGGEDSSEQRDDDSSNGSRGHSPEENGDEESDETTPGGETTKDDIPEIGEDDIPFATKGEEEGEDDGLQVKLDTVTKSDSNSSSESEGEPESEERESGNSDSFPDPESESERNESSGDESESEEQEPGEDSKQNDSDTQSEDDSTTQSDSSQEDTDSDSDNTPENGNEKSDDRESKTSESESESNSSDDSNEEAGEFEEGYDSEEEPESDIPDSSQEEADDPEWLEPDESIRQYYSRFKRYHAALENDSNDRSKRVDFGSDQHSSNIRREVINRGIDQQILRVFGEFETTTNTRVSEDGEEMHMESLMDVLAGGSRSDLYEEQIINNHGERLFGIVTDESSSMGGRKMYEAKVAVGSFYEAVDRLGDKFMLTAFGGRGARVIKEPDEWFEWDCLDSIGPRGSTPMADGIYKTLQQMDGSYAREKILIVVTDGMANVPLRNGSVVEEDSPKEQVKELLGQARREGYVILGIGIEGANKSYMYDLFGKDRTIMTSKDNLSRELLRIYSEQVRR